MSHADHEWARELLPTHLAGGLSAEERARLEAHVSGCAECIAEIDALRRFEHTMEETFAPVRPQAGLEERVIRQLRTFPFQRQRPLPLRIASAVAAIVLLGVVGFAVMNFAEHEPDRNATASLRTIATAESDSRVNDRDKNRVNDYWTHDVDGLTVVPDASSTSAVRYGRGSPPVYRSGGDRLKSAEEMAQERSELARADLGKRSDGPAIFFPEAKESDHNETADTDDYRRMKGDSKDFLAAVGGEKRGRQVGGMEFERKAKAPPPVAAPADPSAPAEGHYSYRNNAPPEPAAKPKADAPAFRPGELAVVNAAINKVEPAPVAAEPMSDRDKAIFALAGKPAPATKKLVQDQAQQQPAAPTRKIIRSGDMEFEVESFDSAVVKIDTIAGEEQGVIATVNSEKLPNGKVRGTIVVRVPPDHLATLVIKLRALGDLKSQKLGSEDVTKSYFDLESRLRAARAMEERLLKIIKEGKGEIKDLLLAEKELGEWRTKIEMYEGEKRYYDNLISLSTLTITIFEKEIRAAFGITETEQVRASLEVDDVEKIYKELLAAVTDAKGRILKSDLKKHAANQFAATVNFEVAPDASNGLRDRLKQLGNVVSLDVNVAQQTEGGRSPTPDVKVKRNDSQFFVSLYNLANVDPRLTVHLNLACVDAEKAYKAVLERVEKAAGRVRTSNLNRQKSDQTNGTVDFQVKESEAEAVLLDLRALGETMYLQITENSDVANVTRSKRGFLVNLAALGTVQPRETVTIQLAAKDVAAAYQALSEAIRKAEGRILVANLNENDRRNVTGTLSFDVRREFLKGVDEALKAAGEIYSRASNRLQDAQNVVDSKMKYDLTLFPAANIRPRETVTLALEVGKVDAAVEAVQKVVADVKGTVKDSQHTRGADGRQVSRLLIDVPYRDRRAAASRMKELGMVRVEESRPNPAVPDSEIAVAQFDLTISNDVLVAPDSAPWASMKKGIMVSIQALSWSLTLIMIGLCFILPITAIAWGVWKVAKRKKQPTPAA